MEVSQVTLTLTLEEAGLTLEPFRQVDIATGRCFHNVTGSQLLQDPKSGPRHPCH